MLVGYARFGALVGVIVLVAVLPAAAAVQVGVTSPGGGSSVHGIAKVAITGVGDQAGSVILRIDGKFAAAFGAPFSYDWDTRAVKDGKIQVEVDELDASGKQVSKATADVTVANAITVPTPVTLAWKVTAGSSIATSIAGEAKVTDVITNDLKYVPGRILRALTGTVSGSATDKVVALTAAKLTVDRELTALKAEYIDRSVELAGSGQKSEMVIDATKGEITEGSDKGVPQARAGMFWIALPTKPVDVDNTWTGDLVFLESAQTGTVRKESGTNRLVGFRMWAGEKCALIESRARYTDDMVLELVATKETLRRVKSTILRSTYFSLDTGRVLRCEDRLERMLAIKSDDWGVAADSWGEPGSGTAPGTGASGFGGMGMGPGGPGLAGGMGPGRGPGGGTGVGSGIGSGMGPGARSGMGPGGGTSTTTPVEKVPSDIDLVYAILTVTQLK